MATYDDKINERVERFLDGDMNAEEKADFRKDLKSNKALQSHYEIHQLIDQTLSDTNEASLEATLRSMRPAKVRSLRTYLAAAAAVILLAIAFFLLRNQFGNSTSELPIYAYFETGTMNETVMSTNTEVLLEQAQDAYNAETWLEALPLFDAYLQKEPEHEVVYIYAARAAIAAQSFEKAEQYLLYFESVNSLFAEEASWLKAITLLGQDQNDQAKPILETLVEAKDQNIRRKATDLLKDINQ